MNVYDKILIQQGYSPSAVDEADENTTYIGYFQQGNPTKAIIQQVIKTGNVTQFLYPFGQYLFSFDWEERANYPYEYRKN